MKIEKSKVVILPCSEYEETLVYEQMGQGLELLGGVRQFIEKDEKDITEAKSLKKAEVEKAVITHPVVMGAFARILRENGYEYITAGDSCGTGNSSKVMEGTGMEDYMKQWKIPVLDFSSGIKVSYEEGHQATEFVISKEVLEADAIVNLCKMKTHALERVTGAVKNMYGCIHGLHKAKGHTKYPSADSFARMLVDLNLYLKPRLYVMDGITAMEGNGPGSGDPVSMQVILMSQDPVALDSVFCNLIHLKPEMVPTNYHGEKMGLGHYEADKIEILTPDGTLTMEEAVEKFGNKEFRVDRQREKSDVWVKMARFFNVFQKKPYIVSEKCIKCGICVESCPVEGKAVNFKKGRKQPPVYNYRKCIRCFCCQEMCPKKAIEVKRF